MRLHCDMCIQVVQCAIGLFAAIPTALVHPLNFFITATWALMLLRTGNRDKRVYLIRIHELQRTTKNRPSTKKGKRKTRKSRLCATSQKAFLEGTDCVHLSSPGLAPGGVAKIPTKEREYNRPQSRNQYSFFKYIPDQDAAQQQGRERQNQP